MTRLTCATTIQIPIEDLKTTAIWEEHRDYMVNLKVAKEQYAAQGYEVVETYDFEEFLLLYLMPETLAERALLDDYLRIKVAQSKRTPGVIAFAEKCIAHIGLENIKKLLMICRLDGYLGGPGFPDLLLFKDGKVEMRFVLIDTLLPEQRSFVLLARDVLQIIGKDAIKIANAVPMSFLHEPRFETFTVKELLDVIKANTRSDRFIERLDALIAEETNKDEIAYLKQQKETTPFYLYTHWCNTGVVDSADVYAMMDRINAMYAQKRKDFSTFASRARADPTYQAFGADMSEESLHKRQEYFQHTFGLGESRALDFLKFMTTQ